MADSNLAQLRDPGHDVCQNKQTNTPPDVFDNPAGLIQRRIEGEKALASALKGLVLSSCVVQIQGRPYVTVTGLTAVARGLGLTVLETSCGKDDVEGGYVAVAEIRDEADRVVGRGSGFVAYDEMPWRNRPEFARRAMACTRAAGRALRLVLAPVIVAMGYEAVAAEEMPRGVEATTGDEATSGNVSGVPRVLKRNSGRSKKAMLVAIGDVEAYVNDSLFMALMEECEEAPRAVDMSWTKRGKWTSCDEARPV